jgi:hypothetical protein
LISTGSANSLEEAMVARISRSIRTIEGAMIKDERPSQTKSNSHQIKSHEIKSHEINRVREGETNPPKYCDVFAALAPSRGQALRLDSRAVPRRCRTLKCDEDGAPFFLHQEIRRLACDTTKNENRHPKAGAIFQENRTYIPRKRYDRRSCRQCVQPHGTDPLTQWTQ